MDFTTLCYLLLGLCSIKVGDACLNGYVRHDDSCYHISHDLENWMSAMFACQLNGGSLAEIETVRENTFLANFIQNHSVSKAWIGAADLDVEGEWIWYKNKQPLSYTNWKTGEPNNDGGHGTTEDCVEQQSTGLWNDNECSSLQHYLCEMAYEDVAIIG